jgi:hypothetical protein
MSRTTAPQLFKRQLTENDATFASLPEKKQSQKAKELYANLDDDEKKQLQEQVRLLNKQNKKADTALDKYKREHRPILKEECSELKPKEITDMLIQQFNALDDETKEKYIILSLSKNEKIKYFYDIAHPDTNLSIDDIVNEYKLREITPKTIYKNEVIKEIKEGNPKLSSKDINKMIDDCWKNESSKLTYKLKALDNIKLVQKKEALDKPKKMTGWTLFMKEVRDVIKQEYPEYNPTDIRTELSTRWKEADQEEWKKKASEANGVEYVPATRKISDLEKEIQRLNDIIKKQREEIDTLKNQNVEENKNEILYDIIISSSNQDIHTIEDLENWNAENEDPLWIFDDEKSPYYIDTLDTYRVKSMDELTKLLSGQEGDKVIKKSKIRTEVSRIFPMLWALYDEDAPTPELNAVINKVLAHYDL